MAIFSFGMEIWTGRLFTPFLIALGVELAVFIGFLGWLLIGLRNRDRREDLEAQFRQRLYELVGDPDEAEHPYEELSDVAETYPDEIVRQVLLEAIQDSETDLDVERLVEFYREEGYADKHLRHLKAEGSSKRLEALRALIGIAKPEDLEQIRSNLSDSNIERTLAGRIALEVGTPQDIIAIFHEVDLRTRLMEEPVFAVLESMSPSDFAEVFDAWGEFESHGMKRVLLRVAGDFGLEDCERQLREAANSPHLELRTAACDAAANFADLESLEIIKDLLDDDEPAVRARAASSLGKHGGSAAIEPLKKAMTDSEFWVRQNAAASLRRLGSEGKQALYEIAEHSEDSFAIDTARQEIERTQLEFEPGGSTG